MGRFAHDIASLPPSLDGAADQLQASIERYTRGLLRGADARVSAISDHAARRVERAANATTARHAGRVLDEIDQLETRITASFTSLKEELEALLATLEKLRPGARAGNELSD